jgi:hypothetical protein
MQVLLPFAFLQDGHYYLEITKKRKPTTIKNNMDIMMLNDVPYMTDEELKSHCRNKQSWFNDYSERK